jgi:hypothetical protein
MQENRDAERILNLPIPYASAAPPPPQATMEEYIEFIQFILDTTDPEQIIRQKQREDNGNLARFKVKDK